MADAKKPNREDPKSATPPDADAEFELSDEQLDKVAGGLARLRFDAPRPRPDQHVITSRRRTSCAQRPRCV